MRPGESLQRFKIGENRFDEIFTNPIFPRIVKLAACFQVPQCILEDEDSHFLESFKLDRSWSNVRNLASSFSARSNRRASSSPCQSGDGVRAGSLEMASQRRSIVRRRSVMDIASICDASSMGIEYYS